MSARLVFLEEAGDARTVDAASNAGFDRLLIALSPRSSYEADKLGIPYRNPEDYYSSDDAFRLGREHTMPVLAAACEYADGFLDQHSPTCRQYGLRPFEASRYKLSFAFDSTWLTAFALARIFSVERPSLVSHFSTCADVLNEELSFRQESIASRLVPLFADARNVQSELIRRAVRPVHPSWRGKASRIWRFIGGGLLRRLDLLGPHARGEFSGGKGGPTFFVLDRGYDIDPICDRLVRGGSGTVVYWDSLADGNAGAGFTTGGGPLDGGFPDENAARAKSVSELARCWELLRRDETFRSFFRFEEVDAFPVLERRLSHIVNWSTPRQLAVHLRAGLMFDQFRPSGVIAAEINSYWRIEIAKVARTRQIPVVVYQHGGSYGYAQVYAHEYTALKWADFFLAYGDGVSQVFERKRADPRSPVRAKVLAVGSSRLDLLARHHVTCRRTPTVPVSCEAVVVYVCDGMVGRSRRLPPVEYENNQYFRWQKRLIALFEQHPSVLFLIRPFPDPMGYSPLAEYVKDRQAGHLRVVSDIPFSELLGTADLFLMDYVGTALLEALTTAKKIVLFADRVARDIEPAAVSLLEPRVLIATSIENYISSIDSILSAKAWGDVASPDDQFLRTYGTHLNDGRSCDRAVEALLHISRDPSTLEVSA